jgi:hypothetical protein
MTLLKKEKIKLIYNYYKNVNLYTSPEFLKRIYKKLIKIKFLLII